MFTRPNEELLKKKQEEGSKGNWYITACFPFKTLITIQLSLNEESGIELLLSFGFIIIMHVLNLSTLFSWSSKIEVDCKYVYWILKFINVHVTKRDTRT